MFDPYTKPCAAFVSRRLLISGSLADVAIAVARSAKATEAALVFDDATGGVVDLDLRGSDAEFSSGCRTLRNLLWVAIALKLA